MQRCLPCLILRHLKQFVTFASLAERFPLLWDVHLEEWRKRGNLIPPFYAKHSSTLTTWRIAADNKVDQLTIFSDGGHVACKDSTVNFNSNYSQLAGHAELERDVVQVRLCFGPLFA